MKAPVVAEKKETRDGDFVSSDIDLSSIMPDGKDPGAQKVLVHVSEEQKSEPKPEAKSEQK